jgi:hypothetical protein
MNKIAIVVLSDPEQSAGLGLVVNALMAAKEFKDNKDDVRVVFSGIGTKWLAELAKPDHLLHQTYNSLKDNIAGACGFCAAAFGVTGDVKTCGITVLEEYGNNMSYLRLANEGYTVLTF